MAGGTYDAGQARATYSLDTSQFDAAVQRAIASYRELQSAQSAAIGRLPPLPPIPAPNIAAPLAALGEMRTALTELSGVAQAAIGPEEAFIATVREQAATLGLSSDELEREFAEMSKAALAAGELTRALTLQDAALGRNRTDTDETTQASIRLVQAEAQRLKALGQLPQAYQLLSNRLNQENEVTVQTINAERQLIAIQQQAARGAEQEANAAIRTAQAQARAAVAEGERERALTLLNAVQTSGASAQVVAGLETQIATLERGTIASEGFGAAFSSSLTSMLGPVALVTTALGAADSALRSFGDAAHFVGQLQEERNAFGGILGDFQRGNAILDEAIARTRVFGFTEKETTDAFRELAPVIRESTASTRDEADALARMAVLRPDDPVHALAQAIEGIRKGRFAEVAGEMGLTKTEAHTLAEEVAHGKDAFLALNTALDKHGITLQVAAQRTEGLIGKERELAQAQEDLQKAQGEFAAGPGLAILETQLSVTRGTTRLLDGDFQAMKASLLDAARQGTPAFTGLEAVFPGVGDALRNAALQSRTLAEQQSAIATATAEATPAIDEQARATALLAGETAHLADEHRQATPLLQQVSSSVQTFNLELVKNANAAALSSAESEILRNTQGQLSTNVLLAANGMLGAGNQAELLAQKEHLAVDQAQLLIDAQKQLTTVTQDQAAALQLDAQQKQLLTDKTRLLQQQTQAAADEFIRLHPALTADQAAALAFADGLGPVVAQLVRVQVGLNDATNQALRFQGALGDLAHLSAEGFGAPSNALPGTRAVGATSGTSLADIFGSDRGIRAVTRDLAQQHTITQAQFQLDLARAKTAAQRIAVLQQEQAATTDVAEKIRLQAQIESERNSAAKAHTSELDKQLKLNESIDNSLDSQLKAQIDIRKLSAQDTLDRLKESRELATAERILASSRASADFKTAAAARIQLIQADQAERALAIQQAQETAGGSIINGRIFRTVPRAGGPAQPTIPQLPPPGGFAPIQPQPPVPGGGAPFTVQFVVDGKVIAQAILPEVFAAQRASLSRAQAGAVRSP